MKDNSQKIRIKDIAILAGVSEGTVDRVLHKRGDVSEKSREAVNKVLKEINYTPNLLARSLASKKQYHFMTMIPVFQKEDYWEIVDMGFDLAVQDFIHYNVQITKKYFDQFDVDSFKDVAKKILEEKPDGVILAPIFKEETLQFISDLKMKKIAFSFIDSLIPDTDFLTYYGQNSFQSGYIAAKLLLKTLPEKSQILVIRTKRNGSISNQTTTRYEGFMNYIEVNGLASQLEVVNVELINNENEYNIEILEKTFLSYSKIKAAITFNSKVYVLANYLEQLNHIDIQLIGYDLLKQNIENLQKGVIDYLIAQRPEKQAYFTVRDMCRELIFNQEIKKINYVPVDILIKENIDDYIHFNE